MAVSGRLRRLIVRRAVELGLTPHRLAAKADISVSQLYRYFNGTSDLASERVDRLLAVLKLTCGPRAVRPRRPGGADTESPDGPDESDDTAAGG